MGRKTASVSEGTEGRAGGRTEEQTLTDMVNAAAKKQQQLSEADTGDLPTKGAEATGRLHRK